MNHITRIVKQLLSNVELFSRLVIKVPLRRYQLEPLRAVVDSVLNQRGLDFLLVFPRQSGKNELVAHLVVYLLNIFQRAGGNLVFGAVGDGVGRMVRRVEERLDNPWNAGRWRKGTMPTRRTLGQAAVVFLSTHPSAAVRGETAHWLLVIDELQDQDPDHLEAVFEPMRAANNATSLAIGTVRLTGDALWARKMLLERMEQEDGLRRVFMVSPDQVAAENPHYAEFLESKVRRLGRHHPIVASEYYLEPIDGAGRLFDDRRVALMRGTHPRERRPMGSSLYLATLDVAGQDEAATDLLAQLRNPARDYTVATIFRIEFPGSPSPASGTPITAETPEWDIAYSLPRYLALDVFVDHGSRHFQEIGNQPSLVQRLVAWLEMWKVAHLVADQSGVGQGIVDWLTAVMGSNRVTGYDMSGAGKKAALGTAFLSVIETGRFKYWAGEDKDGGSGKTLGEDQPLSDGWWFWQQVQHCTYSLSSGGRFERDLQWEVPPSARVSTPTGKQLVHDDRLLSASLIGIADQLIRQGNLRLGTASSGILPPYDPLSDTTY